MTAATTSMATASTTGVRAGRVWITEAAAAVTAKTTAEPTAVRTGP